MTDPIVKVRKEVEELLLSPELNINGFNHAVASAYVAKYLEQARHEEREATIEELKKVMAQGKDDVSGTFTEWNDLRLVDYDWLLKQLERLRNRTKADPRVQEEPNSPKGKP